MVFDLEHETGAMNRLHLLSYADLYLLRLADASVIPIDMQIAEQIHVGRMETFAQLIHTN